MELPVPIPESDLSDATLLPVYLGMDTIQVVPTQSPISTSFPVTPTISNSDTITAPISLTRPSSIPINIAPVPAPVPQSKITDVPILIFGNNGSTVAPAERKTPAPSFSQDSSMSSISSSTGLTSQSAKSLPSGVTPNCVLSTMIASLGLLFLMA